MNLLFSTVKKQRGVATLFVSIMMLIIIGLMTLYTNRSVIIEQRSATNEYKQAQALEAAQSGMARFMGQLGNADPTLNWSNFFTQSGSVFTLKAAFQNTLNNNGYLNSANNVYTNDFSSTNIALEKTLIHPKDDSGNEITGIVQTYKVFLAPTGTQNQFRLITQGCADSCSYAQAFTITDFTVGQTAVCPLDINGALTAVAGASIHGLVGTVPGYNCGVTVGTASGTLGDVAGCSGATATCNPGDSQNYDPRYTVSGSLGKDAHFQKYYPGTTQAAVFADRSARNAKTGAARTACVITGNATQVDLKNCANLGINEIYVTGDVNITASDANLGSALPNGVDLIVAGDFNLTNTTFTMMGSLYVSGTTSSNMGGSLAVYGSAAFAGNVVGNLSLSVFADSRYSKIPAGSGVNSNLTVGSWRDF